LNNNLRNDVIQPKFLQHCTDALKRLDFIVPEFITWYYKEDNLTRVQHLITAARPILSMYASEPFLIPLFSKMDEFQQLHTFEAFHLFSQVHYFMENYSYKNEDPEVQAFCDEIKAKSSAPIG
jgi:hypothetical protein